MTRQRYPIGRDRREPSETKHADADGFRWDWITFGVVVMIALILTLFIL